MIDFDRVEGLSPETIELTDADIQALKTPGALIPDALLKEIILNIDTEQIAKCIKSLHDVLKPAVDKKCKIIINYMGCIEHIKAIEKGIDTAPNSRIKHLALHAKKRRVRKKNTARLLREQYYRYSPAIMEIDEIHELKTDPAIILSAPAIRFKERGSIYDSNNN